MKVHAIVLAGGSGSRFGGNIPKQFARLGGQPVLTRALRAVAGTHPDRIVIVANGEWLSETCELLQSTHLDVPTTVVVGGRTRNESTRSGLDALAGLAAADDDVVLIHEAVRPLLPPDVVTRSIEPIIDGRADAVGAAIPTTDTLMVVDGERVVEVPPRVRFRREQTPQVFRFAVIRDAYAAASAADDLDNTDDIAVVMRYFPAARVVAVAGDEVNFKITTKLDLLLADRLIEMSTNDLQPAPAGSAVRTPAGAE